MSTITLTESKPKGAVHTYLQQLGLMMQWQFRRITDVLPLLIILQIILAIATIAGFGLLVGDPDPNSARYLATGAPTMTLISIGLVFVPQIVGRSRIEGSFDWLRTLPLPREIYLISDLVVWSIVSLPGLVVGVIAGSIRFGAEITPTLMVLPVALLVSLTSASIGYAITMLLAPAVAQLISQVLLFIVLLFTPISFPPERMADWAQQIHKWVPLQSMADAMRYSLAPDYFSVSARAWIVLVIWCALSLVIAVCALRRRE